MANILFADDDKTMRNALQIILKSHTLHIADSKESALEIVRKKEIDLLLSDLHIPQKSNGLSLISESKAINEDLYIVVITGFASIETAVEAMKYGADDYMSKEFTPDSLRLSVDKFLADQIHKKKLKKLEAENRILRNGTLIKDSMIGNSIAMRTLKEKIELIAGDNESSVLILGKSGTGKELAAQAIHNHSNRGSGSFIPIDCPTIPKDLFEAELFGYERGGFTDAKTRKMGRIELADNGTLFLDEIGDLPVEMQAKLLRFLETASFYRIGGTKAIEVDVRVLASTNRDLTQMVGDGLFREDLYYRLSVVKLPLPDLNERGEDKVELAHYFLKKFMARKKRKFEFSESDLSKIAAYHWPGNIRELKNAVENFTIMGELPIPEPHNISESDGAYKTAKQRAMLEFEKKFIKNALAKHERNITQTAKSIGISREELSRKIKKLKL